MAKVNPVSSKDVPRRNVNTPEDELPTPDVKEERAKASGQTESQKAIKEYHDGKFQTHDPVTGEKRDQPLS